MSGGKYLKTNKAEELWDKLLLSDRFKSELLEIRKSFGGENKETPELLFRIIFLLKDYGVTPTTDLRNLCLAYLLGKDVEYKMLGDFPIRLQSPSPEELKSEGRAFLKLWVYDGVSRDEVIDYIKKNWRMIKKVIEIQDIQKVKRVRPILDRSKIEKVLKYDKLSTKDLLRHVGFPDEKRQYREILIQRMMEESGYSITPETIKGILARYKKNT